MAFLAHSDRGTATADLLAFLASPPADVNVPEEDRALLLAPQALGRIAGRGDAGALEALLEITSGADDARPLAGAARRAMDPQALRADLLEMALRGLAFSRSPQARARLEEIALGRLRLDMAERDPRAVAREALALLEGLGGAGPKGSQPPGRGAAGGQVDGALVGGTLSLSGPSTDVLDTQSRVHNAPLTYASHVNVPNPMTNARLDTILRDANLRAGREDFFGDVACCATVSRSGGAQGFGAPADGLDMIDNDTEISTVLNDPTARVKVVRAINWCGTSGTNIIGCAWIGGNGMTVVRLTTVSNEGILWLHEYGHNVGLSHTMSSGYIMNGTINIGGGLTQAHCDRFHSPLAGAGMIPVDTGACADSDADLIHDGADNCPTVANPGQADFDSDFQGDPCDADDDNDGTDDTDDCAPLNAQVWSAPGEAGNLTIMEDTVGTLLSWDLPSESGGAITALKYDTIQSESPDDFIGAAICVESNNGPDTIATTTGRAVPSWIGEGNAASAQIGVSVAGAGDVNNDGFRDLVAGAPTYEDLEIIGGAVFVFPGSAAGPTGAPWKLSIDQSFVFYGGAVDGAGDVNNDGFDDVIAGASGYNNGAPGEGRAFVYHGSAAGPAASAWSPSGGKAGAHFGASVARAGDVNNDGFDDVIVGAPDYDSGGLVGEGRAFAYHGSASGLGALAPWSPGGAQAGSHLGASVAGAGDVNNDGFDDVIVGAPGHDGTRGRAYIYHGSATGLGAAPAQTLEGGQPGAGFGSSVAGAGDVNGDGFDDVIVGSPVHDNSGLDQGRAFLYMGSDTGIDPNVDWTVGGDQNSALFGVAVASAGDVSGDGIADVAVGASFYSSGQPFEGRTYLFLGSSLGLHTGAIRIMDEDQFSSGLGSSLGGAGDMNGDGLADLVVGAPGYDSEGEEDEGRVLLYPGSTVLSPAPGSIFFYLVRPENSCGSGPAGFSSAGAPIAALACP